MIRHKIFLVLTAAEILLLLALFTAGAFVVRSAERHLLPDLGSVATDLALTDLALWTEARYTRHPSQADFFSPFQDFPSALEHFPAGSILGPATLRAAASRPGRDGRDR